MARFDKGYVLSWRSLFRPDKQNNIFYGRGLAIAIFHLLIHWANYEDGKTALPGQKMILKRGQLVSSTAEIAEALGFSPHIVNYWIKWLKSSNQIDIETSNKGTIITILEYEKFQSYSQDEPQADPQAENKTNLKRTLNDYEHNEEVKKIRSKESKKDIPVDELVAYYNQTCKRLPQCKKLTPKRRQKIIARFNEEPSLDYWKGIIDKLASIPFLNGDSRSGWRADIDWLFANQENHLKIAEGKYNTPPPGNPATPFPLKLL